MNLTEELPSDLQHELELISDYLQAQENMLLDPKNKTILNRRDTLDRENRIIKVPRLGTITFKDYDLPEMPSPTMASIDG